MTQLFRLLHREKRLSHFDLKKLSHWRNYNSTNFISFSQIKYRNIRTTQ